MALRLKTLFRKSRLVRPWNPSFVRLHRSGSRPFLWMLLLALGVACILSPPAAGQADVNDVHVMPRQATPHEVALQETPNTSP
jgi:hypothetical protein